MNPRAKFVCALTQEDQVALERMRLHGPTARQRQRAQAVLLSSRGYTLDQLADICEADRDTVSVWLDAWQKQGIHGLADAPKPGRRRKIDASLETVLRDILIENPSPNMKALLQEEIKKRGINLLEHRETMPQTPGLYLSPRTTCAPQSGLP